jgi:predicted urease superfamily metal-dependent hydrolase
MAVSSPAEHNSMWWKRLLRHATPESIRGTMYRVPFTLYSIDGKRAAEIREFDKGQTYILESDWVSDTTFSPRHNGALVGPFASTKDAELFIVATSWFNGPE